MMGAHENTRGTTLILFLLLPLCPHSLTAVQDRDVISEVMIRIYKDDVSTRLNSWKATLRCLFDIQPVATQNCSKVTWSHINYSQSDVIEDVQRLHNTASNDTHPRQGEIIIDTNREIYQVQSEISESFSQLDILQTGESQKGQYSCTLACGTQLYSVACLVSDFVQHNRSLKCSEKTYPLSAENKSKFFHNKSDDIDHVENKSSSVPPTSTAVGPLDTTDRKVFAVVGVITAVVVVLILLRCFMKKSLTTKTFQWRPVRQTTSSQDTEPQQRRRRRHRNRYAHHQVSGITRELLTTPVSSEANNSRPVDRVHPIRSPQWTSGVRSPQWSPLSTSGVRSPQWSPLSTSGVRSPQLCPLSTPGVRSPPSLDYGGIILQHLSDGSQLIYVPARTLPSYEDAVAEIRTDVTTRNQRSQQQYGKSLPVVQTTPNQSELHSESQAILPRQPDILQQQLLPFPQLRVPPPRPPPPRTLPRSSLQVAAVARSVNPVVTSSVPLCIDTLSDPGDQLLVTSSLQDGCSSTCDVQPRSRPPSYNSIADTEESGQWSSLIANDILNNSEVCDNFQVSQHINNENQTVQNEESTKNIQ